MDGGGGGGGEEEVGRGVIYRRATRGDGGEGGLAWRGVMWARAAFREASLLPASSSCPLD